MGQVYLYKSDLNLLRDVKAGMTVVIGACADTLLLLRALGLVTGHDISTGKVSAWKSLRLTSVGEAVLEDASGIFEENAEPVHVDVVPAVPPGASSAREIGVQ